MDSASSDIDWATGALAYLEETRSATHDQFVDLLQGLREAGAHSRKLQWFAPTKDVILTLNRYTDEFPADCKVPGERYASPNDVANGLEEYLTFLRTARNELVDQGEAFRASRGAASYPSLIVMTLERIRHQIAALEFVANCRSQGNTVLESDLNVLKSVVRRFDEVVSALEIHPRSRPIWKVTDEWDCQYLLRSILAGFFRDVRMEEWNPSFAGAGSRCEFFIKPLSAMIEVKYVRKASDQARITSELALDMAQYGANPQVECLIALIYDPERKLKNPVQLQDDFSGSTGRLNIQVIVSPAR